MKSAKLWQWGLCTSLAFAMVSASACSSENDGPDTGSDPDASPGDAATDSPSPTDATIDSPSSSDANTDAPADAEPDAGLDATAPEDADAAIDHCAEAPCLNGATCTDTGDGYTCQCTAHYEGLQCATCATGRDDCNEQSADGCETLLASAREHCGACGNTCDLAQICSRASCITPPTALTPGQPVDFAAGHSPRALAVADVDRDGVLDVLVANGDAGSTQDPSGSLSVFKGNGDGSVRAETHYPGATLSSNAVVVADVNGDGWLDAITVNGQTNLPATAGTISVYLNLGVNAPGTFDVPVSYPTGSPGSLHLCAADFDGDGVSDVATTSVVNNQVSVLRGQNGGSFAAPSLVPILSTGGAQSSIACRDLNGDGAADLVVTSPASARLSVLLNDGDGALASPVAYSNSQNGQTAGLAFGDVDGDGVADLLSNGAAGAYVYWFRGAGDGTFAPGVASPTGASPIANSALGLVASDFNADGKLDVYMLRSTASGGVLPMTGNGAGAFTAGATLVTGSSPALNAIAVADMDGNGYADLVLTNAGSGTVTIVPNAL